MAKNVTTIPATISRFTAAPINSQNKRKVAGYARVSTDQEEQLTSYEAQVDYYTNYIKSRDDWEFIDVYTDEGITGTSTKRREGFKRMVADALAGKIDLIVTKSVSRFARNTVDSLTTIRNLKEKNVECYFEKENIWTFDGKGELLLTIMSSLAQEEARSISENCTWGQRKRMQDGKVSVPFGNFLGYDRGEDGNLIINHEEAAIVRRIYSLFLQGTTPYGIARILTKDEILSPGGKEKWNASTIRSILANEKYKGDALLQKRFTVDFLNKKMKVNEGEVPQYYVQNNHPAIIEPNEFDVVQAEIERRKKLGRPCGCHSPFSARIVCGECGGYYGSKVWGSNTKYRRTVWRCNDKYKGDQKCETPHVTEEDVKQRFLAAFNYLHGVREELIADCRLAQTTICDYTEIDSEILELHREMEVVVELSRKAIHENSRIAVDQDEWNERNNSYLERHQKASEQLAELESSKRERQNKHRTLETFIANINARPLVVEEFDERLWAVTVEKVTVMPDGKLVFFFKNGTEIEG